MPRRTAALQRSLRRRTESPPGTQVEVRHEALLDRARQRSFPAALQSRSALANPATARKRPPVWRIAQSSRPQNLRQHLRSAGVHLLARPVRETNGQDRLQPLTMSAATPADRPMMDGYPDAAEINRLNHHARHRDMQRVALVGPNGTGKAPPATPSARSSTR